MKIRRRKVLPKTEKSPSKKYSGSLRAAIKERSLKDYRQKTAGFELANCLRSLDYFEDKAERIPVAHVDYPTMVAALPIFQITTVAELLEKTYQSFWRWTTGAEPIVPPPVLVTKTGGRELQVYHLEEVRHLIKTIGEHGKSFAYYRKDHVLTRKKLFDGIETIRNETILKELSNASTKARSTPERHRPGKGGTVGGEKGRQGGGQVKRLRPRRD